LQLQTENTDREEDGRDALLESSAHHRHRLHLTAFLNAIAESFMKTLKYEEVYCSEYLDFDDANRQIGRFIGSVYNHKRLHSSLGYRPPVEFESEFIAERL
jgi:transposase InsO family protein